MTRLTIREFDDFIDASGCDFDSPRAALVNNGSNECSGTIVSLCGITKSAKKLLRKFPDVKIKKVEDDASITENMVYIDSIHF